MQNILRNNDSVKSKKPRSSIATIMLRLDIFAHALLAAGSFAIAPNGNVVQSNERILPRNKYRVDMLVFI